jgi:hypothetical protein
MKTIRNTLSASVVLKRHEDGSVKMTDLMEVEWCVHHADGSNPTEAEFNTMLAEKWGWFDIKHDYVLKRVKEV